MTKFYKKIDNIIALINRMRLDGAQAPSGFRAHTTKMDKSDTYVSFLHAVPFSYAKTIKTNNHPGKPSNIEYVSNM